MTHGVYRASLKTQRIDTQRKMLAVEATLATLRDPASRYARELSAMHDLYRQVADVYGQAPDDLAEDGT